MRKSLAVFLWILVGAIASGLGIGYFLYRANQDLKVVSTERKLVSDQIDTIRQANETLAREANTKVQEANREVEKAQTLLQLYAAERELLLKATLASGPTPTALKQWKTTVSPTLGISLSTPANVTATTTERAIVVSLPTASSTIILASAYNIDQEKRYTDLLRDTKDIAFRTNNDLFIGKMGTADGISGITYLLRNQRMASSTHLFWMRTDKGVTEKSLLDILGTVQFRP